MKIDIDYLAKLANIPLTDEEKPKFTEQVKGVINFIDKLNGVDTSNVLPTYQVTGRTNVFRDDMSLPSLDTKDAFRNAPRVDGGKIVTKGVFEDE